MPRPRAIPKINSVVVKYNGDKKSFEIFMESMIKNYLNSCSIANPEPPEFVGKVEKNMKSACCWNFGNGCDMVVVASDKVLRLPAT